MLVRVAKARKPLFGQERERTLSDTVLVRLAYDLGGWWREAEELFVQDGDFERVPRREHPSELTEGG